MLSRRSSRLAARLLLVAVAGLAGCSHESRVLARVGSRVLTVDDFVAAASGAESRYGGTPDEAKSQLLDDLMRRLLLLRAADDRGLSTDSATVNYRRAKSEELLIQALSRQLSPPTVGVSAAEMSRFYAWRDSATHVQLIYAFTRDIAQSAVDQVRRTGDFASVATRINPPGVLPPGGDIGDQTPGSLAEALDTPLRTTPVGSVVGPIEAPGQGWFVMKVVGRKARTQPDFTSQQPLLSEMLRQRKQMSAAVRNYLRLRDSYQLELLPGAGQKLFADLNLPPGAAPPSYSKAELAQPLARWSEASRVRFYTLGEALYDLDHDPGQKPAGSMLPSIEEWIRTRALRQIVLAEARRRCIDQDPAWRRAIDETVNNYVLEAYYREEVIDKAQATPDDARLVYARNSSRYAVLEDARLTVLDLPDTNAVNALSGHAGHAPTLRAAAAMLPGAPPVKDVDVKFPTQDPEWSRFQPTIAGMHEGEALGPFPIAGGGFRIIQLVAKTQHVPAYDALPADAKATLDREALEVARERRLLELVDDARRFYRPEVHRERLKRVPWPVPSPTAL